MLYGRCVGRGGRRCGRGGAIAEAAPPAHQTASAAAPGAQVEFGNEGGDASADGYRDGGLRVGRDRGGRVLQAGRGRAAASFSASVSVLAIAIMTVQVMVGVVGEGERRA